MKKFILYNLFICLLFSCILQVQAQKVNIILKINEESETTVYQDESALLDVAVFNRTAQANRRWNRAGEERMEELGELLKLGKIKQDEFDREKINIKKNRRETGAVTLGSSTSSWTSAISFKVMNTGNRNYIDLPLKLMKKPETAGEALMDADGYFMACYGISPDDMRSVPPGTYAIECFINNIPSNAVLFIVKPGVMDKALAGSEPALLRAGRYYWHDEDGEKTMQFASKILVANPGSLDGLSLKADAQVMLKQYLPALETYNLAIKEYYRQNGAGAEPPDYLYSMIDFIKKQMAP
jgi:hypothetical protein